MAGPSSLPMGCTVVFVEAMSSESDLLGFYRLDPNIYFTERRLLALRLEVNEFLWLLNESR